MSIGTLIICVVYCIGFQECFLFIWVIFIVVSSFKHICSHIYIFHWIFVLNNVMSALSFKKFNSWTARRSNQSILKEINPGISLEGMMLKLKLQYFGHLMRRVDSLEKNSDAGRDWGQEEKGTTEDEMAGWHHRLDGRESA